MKYPYLTVSPPPTRGPFLKRPAVMIEIFGPKRSIKVLGVVDSGADRSLFNSEIARAVGIDLEGAVEGTVTGITGQQRIWSVDEVRIKVEHLDPVMVPVNFIDSPYVGVLLGQEGFFDSYRIKFEKDHDTFEINPVRK